jgi:hypothetical protein
MIIMIGPPARADWPRACMILAIISQSMIPGTRYRYSVSQWGNLEYLAFLMSQRHRRDICDVYNGFNQSLVNKYTTLFEQ